MTTADALAALKRAMTDAGWIQYRLGWGKPVEGIPGVPVYSFLTAVEIQINNELLEPRPVTGKPKGYVPKD